MRAKEWMKRYLLTLCLGVSLTASSVVTCYAEIGATEETQSAEAANDGQSANDAKAAQGTEDTQDGQGTEDAEDTQDGQGTEDADGASADEWDESLVEISSVEELLSLAEECKYDSWSMARTVSLTADLDLTGVSFDGIAYFNGTFEGNGHTISNLSLNSKGSEYGFFRYIGPSGVVRDLNVAGSVKPAGSQEYIGGIVGINYGTVENCSFRGNVNGINYVGAIAGSNRGGSILSCTSEAVILATNYTGGIAGINDGLISGCVSRSSINTEELDPTLDLGGMDLSSFNVTQTVVTRNDMGGIAGTSGGVIMDCENKGIVGYQHTGYNVGGIAGSQNGIITNCTNRGKIYGRKDIGGIVGQAEPYVESEYLKDEVQKTQDELNTLSRTLNNMSATVSQTSAQVRQQAEGLSNQYETSLDNISSGIDNLEAAVQGDLEAQNRVNEINNALDNIKSIQSSGGSLTQEQKDQIQSNIDSINGNLGSLNETLQNKGQSAEEYTQNIAGQLQQSQQTRENLADDAQQIRDMADTIDQGVQSATNSMNSAVNQMNNVIDSVTDDLSILTGDEEIITDISSIETAESMDGVISGCVNYGSINGDLNAGGIAGCMNVEYSEDPEYDPNVREETNVRLRSTVNGVVIHSINYGTVTVKKNCAGGIVGLQELGFIYDCEGYGDVESTSGNYVGGIAGDSAAAIQQSYVLCNVSGTDYAGGISGSGYSVKDCVSVSSIDSEGERLGSIAGYLADEGGVSGNLFVSDEIHGVDNISYAGMADRISYEEAMELDGIPEGFHQVTILFETEDGSISETTIPYGGSLTEEDLPDVPEKEGCYVEWPGLESLTDIRENMTVTAEYVPWMESVASREENENGRSIVLVAGEFYEGTGLTLEEAAGPENLAEDAQTAYAYSWTLESEREKTFDTMEAHFVIPDGKTAEECTVWIKENGTWTQTASEADGSYIVAELPYGADFAVVTQPVENSAYLFVIAGAAVVLVLAIVIVWRRKKKKINREGQKEA